MNMNQSSRLRAQIEEEIATGALRPGERLDEVSLAERFGVSRTPIREALQQLSIAGLIEHRRHRGAVVSAPEPSQLLEMFEVMAELEGMAGALAARRHTEEDRRVLLDVHARCEAAADSDDTDRYYYENEVFHHVIYAASHSGFLEEQCLALHRRLQPYRRLQLRVRNRMKVSFKEHCAIVEAILAGEAEAARTSLRGHIAVQGDRFSDLIATLGDQDREQRRIPSVG